MNQAMELQQVNDAEVAMMELIRNKRFLDLERVPLICKDIAEIRRMMETEAEERKKYVTQESFWPVKTLVYGITGLMLVAVVVALLALVINQKPV